MFSDATNVPSFWLDQRGQQQRPDLTVAAAEQPPVGLAADDDEPSSRREGAPQI